MAQSLNFSRLLATIDTPIYLGVFFTVLKNIWVSNNPETGLETGLIRG